MANPQLLYLRVLVAGFRFLKLLKTMPKTRLLVKSLALSLPSVLNVGGLLLVFMFM